MTALREAAQQALEALENLSNCYAGVHDSSGECASCHERSYMPHAPDCKKQNAIIALRAALAQEEQPARAQQMRDAGYTRRPTLREMAQQEREDIAQNLQSRLDAALLLEERRQEIAQPRRETEQEPVAWQWLNSAYFRKKPPANAESGAWIPLYTHPPRREWQGLTEEEIEDMSVTGTDSELRRQQFARTVEQALKEKNNV
jgi:hypothetical protein